MLMKKMIVFLLLLGLLLALPAIVWFAKSNENLQVAIINKTAPSEEYREHHGLIWLLNHYQYEQSSGEKYNANNDYYGFSPDETTKTYDIKSIPDSLDGVDLIYVADTYGVYEEDLPWTVEDNGEDEEAPSLIDGGLEMEEWQTVKEQVINGGSDLVVEFNSFASPTTERVQEDVTDFLGLNWSGWTGRHFLELSKSGDEIPSWITSRYEDSSRIWDYEGGGFVLVNDVTGEIVVLSEELGEVETDGISVEFTEQGSEMFSLKDSPSYNYWFDISEAKSDDTILANYRWDLGEIGSEKLREHGIPEEFPAVFHNKTKASNVFYFAGDFVDIAEVPRFHQYEGYAAFRSLLSFESFSPETSFFWKTYRPMMTRIFEMASKGNVQTDNYASNQLVMAETKDVLYPSKINGDEFEVYQDGEWQSFTVKGVNMGMAKPGTSPGQAAITKEEYERWFDYIGDMNANALRVYTLHPPAFYEALHSYNESADEPLYLFHGVWIDEEPLEEHRDAYRPEIVESFQEEMTRVVDVIHGNATIEPERGHASGIYHTDVSQYVIGWIIGIEWFPKMVENMNEEYANLGEYDGTYVYTEDANSMEHWLAEQLDVLTKYEISTYQQMRPLSFTNWVTTDNIEQPAEPSEDEDLVSVDPNHLKPKGNVEEAGIFASYHVYPYYPDFLNLEEKYVEYIDHRGEANNYAGYLNDLNASHELPILIAEFGIPASRGKTHENPFGWNQGFISEQEQGEIVARWFSIYLAG